MGDDGAEVLVFADFTGDMLAARKTHDAGGVHAVLVAVFGRHKAVGGQQHGAVKAFKFFFLFPPCIAVVALEVRVLLEGRVVMGGQHFRVGVHVNACAFGLLEQHFKVAQVMPGNEDAGIAAHADVDLGNFWVAVGTGIGSIQQGHGRYAELARFKGQGHKVGHAQAVIQGFGKGFLHEGVKAVFMLAKHIRMFGVGRHALEPKGDEPAQGAHIIIGGGHNAYGSGLGQHGGLFGCFPQGCIAEAALVGKGRGQFLFGGTGHAHTLGKDVVVKVGIGDGGKQVAGNQAVYPVVNGLAFGAQARGDLAEALGHIDQRVLKGGCFRLFAAHAYLGAAFVTHGFLALVAEHGITHGVLSLYGSVAAEAWVKPAAGGHRG